MQLTIELANFLFVVDSFQRGRECAIKHTRAVDNTGEFQAKRNARAHRPNQSPDCESNESTLDRVDHTKPRHVPWFPLASENQNDRSRDARRRESGVNRGEIAEETAKEKQNDARPQRSSSQRAGPSSAAAMAPHVEPIVRYSAAFQEAPRLACVTTSAANTAQYPWWRCHSA